MRVSFGNDRGAAGRRQSTARDYHRCVSYNGGVRVRDPHFRTTRWSVVNAARAEDSSAAQEALAVLCETYWYPLYSFVRRSGLAAHDAEDVTQGFFARLLDKRDIGGADPQRGRFRTSCSAR